MEIEELEWLNNLPEDDIKHLIDYTKQLSKGVTHTENSRQSMKYFHNKDQTNLHYLIHDCASEYFWLLSKVYEIISLNPDWSPETCKRSMEYFTNKDQTNLHYLIHDLPNDYFWVITEIYHTWPFDPEWRVYDPTIKNN